MSIRLVLVLVFCSIMLWFLRNNRTSRMRAGKKLFVVGFFVFALSTVLMPELTNVIAHRLGVGRGADLLLYILSVSFIAYVLNQYLRNIEEEKRIVQLVRKMAILEALQKNGNDTHENS